MITANTVRQSTEGGWWDPPLYLPTYRNYREFFFFRTLGRILQSRGLRRQLWSSEVCLPLYCAQSCVQELSGTELRSPFVGDSPMCTQTEESRFSCIRNVPCTKVACHLIRRYSLILLPYVHLSPNSLRGFKIFAQSGLLRSNML